MAIVLGFVFRVTHHGLDYPVLVDCLEFMLYSYLNYGHTYSTYICDLFGVTLIVTLSTSSLVYNN